MTDHYFTVEPGSAHQPRGNCGYHPRKNAALKTDAGVFSRDRLDLGTKVLESLDLTGVQAPLDLAAATVRSD